MAKKTRMLVRSRSATGAGASHQAPRPLEAKELHKFRWRRSDEGLEDSVKVKWLSVTPGEGTTVGMKWVPGCYRWVLAKWYTGTRLGNVT